MSTPESLPPTAVVSMKTVHDGVARITFETGSVVDVPIALFSNLCEGECLQLKLGNSSATFKEALCVLQGVAYAREGQTVFASFGGLLAKLEGATTPIVNQPFRLAIVRAIRRRKRSAAPEEEVPKRVTRSRAPRTAGV